MMDIRKVNKKTQWPLYLKQFCYSLLYNIIDVLYIARDSVRRGNFDIPMHHMKNVMVRGIFKHRVMLMTQYRPYNLLQMQVAISIHAPLYVGNKGCLLHSWLTIVTLGLALFEVPDKVGGSVIGEWSVDSNFKFTTIQR